MKTLFIASIWIFTLALSYYLGSKSAGDSEPEKVIIEKVVTQPALEPQTKTKTIIVEKTMDKEANSEEKKITDEKIKKFLEERDPKTNLEKLKRECEESDKEFDYSCYKLREHYRFVGLHKKNIQEDRKKCSSGDPKACRKLRWEGDEKDRVFARNISSKLCKQNNAKACEVYAEVLSVDEYKSSQDKNSKTFQIYKKACELDSTNCYGFASMLESQGDERAKDYYELSCKGGDWGNCSSAAHFYLKQGDMANGESMLRSGCENGKEGGTCMEYVNFLISNNRKREAVSVIKATCKDFSIEAGNHLCVRLKNIK